MSGACSGLRSSTSCRGRCSSGWWASTSRTRRTRCGTTGAPIFIAGPGGSLTRADASSSNLFHADLLLSYQPVPGTVVFAGYGSNMVDEEAFQFRGLRRTDDAFFLKLSYLFRL